MRVLIQLGDQRLDRELTGRDDALTLGELIDRAGGTAPGPDTTLYVDDVPATAGTPLGEVLLLEGSTISLSPVPRPQPLTDWSVTVCGGLHAGAVQPIPEHRPLLLGRSPQADIVLDSESASWNHASIQLEQDGVRVRDHGSTNGTQLDGTPVAEDGELITEAATVLVGGTALLLRPQLPERLAPRPGSLHNLTPAATAPFNRPPRPGLDPAPEPLPAPAPKDVAPASKFSYITVLAPLLLAGAMVMMLGDLRFAMFALLSPVMAIGMWFEQKHRHTRNLKEEKERFETALEEFEGQIARAAVREAERRHTRIPDPATTLRVPALPTTALWQRRAGDHDFLALHAGTGNVPWQPEIDRRATPTLDPRVRELIEASHIPAAPVVVDLTGAGVVGIVGEREGRSPWSAACWCRPPCTPGRRTCASPYSATADGTRHGNGPAGCRTPGAPGRPPGNAGCPMTSAAARACCAPCARTASSAVREPRCWCSTRRCSPRAATPRPARCWGTGGTPTPGWAVRAAPTRSPGSSSPPPSSSCPRPAAR